MADTVSTKHYTLDTIDEGVHAAIAEAGGAAIGNAGLVDLGDATLVIDTFLTPSAAEELRADAQRLTGRPARWVLNTHYHNDHIWGNQVFAPQADIISTAQTRALIQTAGQQEYDDYRAVAEERLKSSLAQQAAAQSDAQRAAAGLMVGYFGGLVRDFPRLVLTLPNLVFENRMTLYGSRRRVELIEFAGGHTGSDTVAYLPDDGIVFMSDLLFIGFHPYLGDGDPERAIAALRAIIDGRAGIDTRSRFVPGHGPVGTLADLERLVVYIQESQQMARALAEAGRVSTAEVAATPIPEAYADWMLPHFFHANLNFLVRKYQGDGQPGARVVAGRMAT